VAQATVRAWVNADVTIRLPPGLRRPEAYRPITSEERVSIIYTVCGEDTRHP
jgi:hypothetical protein